MVTRARNLQAFRLEAGLSESEAATLADVTVTTLRRWETQGLSQRDPRRAAGLYRPAGVARLLKACGRTFDELDVLAPGSRRLDS